MESGAPNFGKFELDRYLLSCPDIPYSAKPYPARSSRHDGGSSGGDLCGVRGPRPVKVLDFRGAPCAQFSVEVNVVVVTEAFLKSPKPSP
jgi:hypothetical protein